MLVIRNIAQICTGPRGPVELCGELPVKKYTESAIGIEQDTIAWIRDDTEENIPKDSQILDAGGGCVIPGLIDCHTHTVFAGTREGEFVQRSQGKSYAEIARTGGGIKNTVEAVRGSSLDELVSLALPRLQRMLTLGVTTVEIKSGYGLTIDDELKMLRAVQRLNTLQPIKLVATYLAAHTTPKEFDGNPDGYLDLMLGQDVLDQIRSDGLAEFADVFCETTAFNVEQSRRFLLACKETGMTPRVHADQITQCGASQLAAEVGATSADHLERIDEASITAMKENGTIAVLLPACSFYLGVEQAPARRIIDAGVPVAIATDFNPGSSVVESLPLTMSIACTQMGMTPSQVLLATTSNAAAVLKRHDKIGAIEPNMQADLTILNVPSIEQMCYFAGRNCTQAVVKSGTIVHSQPNNQSISKPH
ncbi:MAG: imidazolonepropionase [Planctomycetes bacterium]|nr:imidazolonepropionase [Planctomycetota bacterium]